MYAVTDPISQPAKPMGLESPRKRHWTSGLSQEVIVSIATVVAALLCVVSVKGFANPANILLLMRSVSILGVLAIGMSIVVIGRGIDLSQVAVMVVATAWTLTLSAHGVPLGAALALGLLFAAVCGLWNGYAIAYIGISPLFATLASGIFIYGVGRWFLFANINTYVPDQAKALLFLGQGTVLSVPVPVIVFFCALATGWLVFARFIVGRKIYALGDNVETARITGLSYRTIIAVQYIGSAVVAYVAGLLAAGTAAAVSADTFNSTLLFDVLLIVVLGGISLSGGRGTMLGILAGTALIGTLMNAMLLLDVEMDIQSIIKSVVLLLAIAIDRRLHPRNEETARQGDL
jgi:ribose transport system permease protein